MIWAGEPPTTGLCLDKPMGTLHREILARGPCGPNVLLEKVENPYRASESDWKGPGQGCLTPLSDSQGSHLR